MSRHILVLNAGSSSLKFSVFLQQPDDSWSLDLKGQVEGIGTSPHWIVVGAHKEVLIDQIPSEPLRDARDALHLVASWIADRHGIDGLVGIGHRVVHGGVHFTSPTIVIPGVLTQLRLLIPLAPLHQPHNLEAIETIAERFPNIPQVACFDTSFHRTFPATAELVPLPQEIRDAGVQRYGFHGLSYEYIASALPQIAPEIASGRVIVAHLGSGASMCAMNNGKSLDNTFGFTALDGLCMGSRPGALDPGVVLYLFQTLGQTAEQVETILYKKSGLLGLSGISNDMRVLLQSGGPSARLAIDYFIYRAAKEIGALTAVLGGLDGLVFTAGIGENSAEIRRRICAACAWLGLELNESANEQHGPRISTRTSKVSTWVIPANEELMIAHHTAALLGLRAAPTIH